MKNLTTIKIVLIAVTILLLSTQYSFAQWGSIGDRIADDLSKKAQQKIEGEINNGADKAYDKTKQKTKESVKNSSKNTKSNNSGNSADNTSDDNGNSNSGNTSSKNTSSGAPSNNSLKAYGKFDFVQGEKVIALEDFSQDAIGDFPAKWNTNGTGELVTLDGQPGKWFKIWTRKYHLS
jgi:OOP family OmpA-OmpF porin